MKSKEMSRLNILIEPDTVSAIDTYAQSNEMDRSKVVRLAVKKFLQIDPNMKKIKSKQVKAS